MIAVKTLLHFWGWSRAQVWGPGGTRSWVFDFYSNNMLFLDNNALL